MNNKNIVSFPSENNEVNDKSILMFCICGGKILYFFDKDIINNEERVNESFKKSYNGFYPLELKTAYTVETSIFPASTHHPIHGKVTMPQAINLVNTFFDIKLLYECIGRIPENSGIIKSIRESQTGIKVA